MKKTALSLLIVLILALLGTSIAYMQSSGSTIFLPLVFKTTVQSGTTTAPTATATLAPTATATATPGAATAYTQNGGVASLTNQTFVATQTDQSGVYVTNGGVLTLADSTVTTSGNTSSNDNSSFYGLNAAVLSEAGSKVTLTDCTITSSGSGANGGFATGSGSSLALERVTIYATGGGAHGVMATQGGVVTLKDVNFYTAGANSAPVATDRGGGTITVTGGDFAAAGQDSPGIYSTGEIIISGATFTATGSEGAVIEGANSIILQDTTVQSSKENKWGVMIYQSMSGDAQGTKGVFTMTGGKLANTAATGPLFYVTNSTGVISLSGVEVSAASGTLLTAAADRWGTSGSNGGQAQLTADGQSLVGNFVADSYSTITLALQNGSALVGAINTAQQASSASLTLDASSNWTVTADSYLTCLADTGGISGATVTNITGNGHTVYYRASACSSLGGLTYTLNGGGTLQPGS